MKAQAALSLAVCATACAFCWRPGLAFGTLLFAAVGGLLLNSARCD